MRRVAPAAVLIALGGVLAACGGASPGAAGRAGLEGRLSVLAAASLTGAFERIGHEFEAAHPGVQVRFSFAGSPTLAQQILEGAPAGVFASADEPNMKKVVDAGLVSGAPVDFATNRLQIVVQAGDPRGIRSLADLARPGLAVVVCAPAVPCGAYARTAFARSGVSVTPKSEEQDVKGVVSKVALGEADAGIVYTTDVKAGGPKVAGVDIPSADNVLARYPITTLKAAANPSAAAAFVAYVRGPAGLRALRDAGFGPPG